MGKWILKMLTGDPLSMEQHIIIDLVDTLDNAQSNLAVVELELTNKNL